MFTHTFSAGHWGCVEAAGVATVASACAVRSCAGRAVQGGWQRGCEHGAAQGGGAGRAGWAGTCSGAIYGAAWGGGGCQPLALDMVCAYPR